MLHLLQDDVQTLALLRVGMQFVVIDEDFVFGGLYHLGDLHLRFTLNGRAINAGELIAGLERAIARRWSVVEHLTRGVISELRAVIG